MGNVKIGDLFTLEKGELQSTKCTPGKYNFITAAEAWKTHNTYTHECEALIFAAAASGSLGRTHYVKGKFVTSDLCFVLRPKSPNKYPINLHFYYYIFNRLQKDIVGQTKTGTSKESINQKNLKSYKLPYFSMDEQNRHLEKIKFCDMTSNSLREEISYQRPLLTKLRQSLLQLAVQGKLVPQDPNDEPASVLLKKITTEKEKLIKEGKIKRQKLRPSIEPDEVPYKLPKGWQWVRLQDCYDVRDGTHDTPKYVSKGIPLITSKDFKKGEIDFANAKLISESDHNIIKKRSLVEKQDILFSMIGGNIGNMVMVNTSKEFSIKNVALFKYYDKNFSLPQYLMCFLTYISKLTQSNAFGGAQPFVSLTYLRNHPFPLPPLTEQKRIVTKVDKSMKLCDELEEKLDQAKTDSDKLMASVVHHLLHPPLPQEQAVTDEKKSQTPYKDDAAVVCFLLAEMEKRQRPTTEFFIQKHIFVTKHHLHLPLNSLFVRKAAGPWSHELKRKAIFAAIKMNWLRWEKSRLVPGSAFEKALSHASTVLGEHAARLVQLVEDLKTFGNNGLERWTTVLKVVEDLKETQQPITRAKIQHEIDNWRDKRLKKIFAEESVDYTITMMLKHKWLPPLDKP